MARPDSYGGPITDRTVQSILFGSEFRTHNSMRITCAAVRLRHLSPNMNPLTHEAIA